MTSTIFISYSHEDEVWKDRLQTQLAAMPSELCLNPWSDRKIGAGEDWYEQITAALDSADIAVLLISAHFLTSKFIMEEEVPRVRLRHANGALHIYPIVVRACNWHRHDWLTALQIRPVGAKPLETRQQWQSEEDLTTIAAEIADVGARPASPPASRAVAVPPPQRAGPETAVPAVASTASTPPPTAMGDVIENSSRVAGAAVRAVAALVRDEDVRAIVERFNAEFGIVSQVIEALTNYKELHDELHHVEFHCYRSLNTESRRREGDEVSWDTLVEHEMTLLASINQIQALADRARFPAHETSWIATLATAHGHLTTAIETHDRKSLRSAAALCSRVLTVEPIKLNDRMTQTTHALDLSPLERALEFVRQRIAADRVDAARVEQVRAGVAALDSLGEAVKRLVVAHDRWQELEFNLRRLEASLAGGIAEVEFSWPSIVELTAPLYAEANEPWARSLASYAEQLQHHLDSDLANRDDQVVVAFRRFRRQAGEQFFRVDANLRDSCGKLGKVGEPLLLILRTVEAS